VLSEETKTSVRELVLATESETRVHVHEKRAVPGSFLVNLSSRMFFKYLQVSHRQSLKVLGQERMNARKLGDDCGPV